MCMIVVDVNKTKELYSSNNHCQLSLSSVNTDRQQ
jgi:hypothetical protein